MKIHTFEVDGKRIVQLPEQEYLALARRAGTNLNAQVYAGT